MEILADKVFTEVTDEVTYVGYHRIDSKDEKTYQILVRPDVTEDCLMTLAQQILITYGGQVTRYGHVFETSSAGLDPKAVSRLGSGRSTPEGSLKDSVKSGKSANVQEGQTQKDPSQEKPQSPYLESVNNTSTAAISVPWQSMRVYLGVNMDLQRCLVLAVKPTAAAAGSNSTSSTSNTDARQTVRAASAGIFAGIGVNTFSALSASALGDASATGATTAPATATTTTAYVSPTRRSFLDFCENIATELNTAMREESLTLDYMSSVPANMTGPMQGLRYGGYGMGMAGSGMGAASRAPDSVIDVPFVRDLHCATVQLMVSCTPAMLWGI